MPANTTNQGVPYVHLDDKRSTVASTTEAMAKYIEERFVMRFDTVSLRNTRVPAPDPGMLCFIENVGELQLYESGGWRTIYPPSPNITSGTSAPSGSGKAGDLYIQY